MPSDRLLYALENLNPMCKVKHHNSTIFLGRQDDCYEYLEENVGCYFTHPDYSIEKVERKCS